MGETGASCVASLTPQGKHDYPFVANKILCHSKRFGTDPGNVSLKYLQKSWKVYPNPGIIGKLEEN